MSYPQDDPIFAIITALEGSALAAPPNKRHAPETQQLRAALRRAVLVKVDTERRRRAGGGAWTSATQLRAERDALQAAGEIQKAKAACTRAGITPSQDSLRLGRRFVGKHDTWAAVLNPDEAAWDADKEQWV